MLRKQGGVNYYAYTAGRTPQAGRDSMVFVHGAAMEHSVWSHQSRYFAHHGYNVAALDLPGHGLSDGAAVDTIPALGAWINRVIGQMFGGGAVHLVGHSMGALAALEAVSQSADSAAGADLGVNSGKNPHSAAGSGAIPFASLTLAGFSYPMAVSTQLLEAARHAPSTAYAMMTQWSHASRLGGEPTPGFWSPGMQMSMLENSRPGALARDLAACHAYADGAAALARVACPILFICGRRDRMAPAKLAAAHVAAHPCAEIAYLLACGHNLMSEAPDGVLAALKRFIAQHRVG